METTVLYVLIGGAFGYSAYDCLLKLRGCRGGQVMPPQGEAVSASRPRERELTQACGNQIQGGVRLRACRGNS